VLVPHPASTAVKLRPAVRVAIRVATVRVVIVVSFASGYGLLISHRNSGD